MILNKPSITIERGRKGEAGERGAIPRHVLIDGERRACWRSRSYGGYRLVDTFGRAILVEQDGSDFVQGEGYVRSKRPREVTWGLLQEAEFLRRAVWAWEQGAIATIDEQRRRHEALLAEEAARRAEDERRKRIQGNAAELLAALSDLLEWGREFTGPTDPNSPHDLLVRAANVIAKIEGEVK